MVKIVLLHTHVAFEHRIFFFQAVQALSLFEQLDIADVPLSCKFFELLTHQVQLLLQQVNLTLLPFYQILLAT